MSGPVTCPKCGGMGYFAWGNSTAHCNLCGRTGEVEGRVAAAFVARRNWNLGVSRGDR